MLHDTSFRRLFKRFGRSSNFNTVEEWICSFESSSAGALYTPHEAAHLKNVRFLLYLDELRRRCVRDIERQLRTAAISQEIPREGTLLVYPDDLSACYLAEYGMAADQMHVHFVDWLSHPRALLRLEDAVCFANVRSRNLAKSFIQSGHKTIVHGGILTHVDRRRHVGVFGPSIDTLLMASIVAEHVRVHKPKTVLEVGIGSGHIYCSAAIHSGGPLYLCGVDIEPTAVLCAATNYLRHEVTFDLKEVSGNLIIGAFDGSMFGRRFDLVVSNPPYIPEHQIRRLAGRQELRGATSGTDLVKDVLEALPLLLNDGGQALMMISSVTPDPHQWLPKGLRIEKCIKPEGVRVPFDVDFALDNPVLLDALKANDGLWDMGGHFEHALRPIWVKKV
jgi:tRNA1(Val) A37 N6-methylase TrmN6